MLAALGPYFVWEPWTAGAQWRPWSELSDGEVAADRVAAARSALAGLAGLTVETVPLRVAASVTFLGYAARVLSPLLGAAVTGGELRAPRPADLWWRPVPGGPLPMAYSRISVRPCTDLDPTELAEALAEVAVDGLLGGLLACFGQRFALSSKVLHGNVASALAGAAGVIAEHAPVHAERAAAVVARMLQRAPLAGAGTLLRPDPDRARWFLVRHNCCLYYRIPGGGTCGDCVLTSGAERRREWQAALNR